MPGFTTRPEIRGTFGVVATTHWIASAVGMGILEKGGNAFDAAVAAGFTLQVVEPHLNGPLGEAPILAWNQTTRRAETICGQGVAPAAATIAQYKSLDLDLIPGTGLLAATVPGAFDAWARLARDYGTMPLAELMEPALGYAENGYPVIARIRDTLATVAEVVSHRMEDLGGSVSAGRQFADSRPALPQPGAGGDVPPRAGRGRGRCR